MTIEKQRSSGLKNTTDREDAALVRKPAFCSIEVLYSCILKCKMCYMWKNSRTKDEMSVEEWKRFIMDLKRFTGTETSINITGGEPFLKENVIDLVRFIVQEGFKEVSMTTNGFLIDEYISRDIADSGMSMISMSLDSIDEEVHDNLRGVSGVCRKMIQALEYLRGHHGSLRKLGIQTIIMGPNLDGILDLVQWAHARKISIYFMAIAQPLCLSLPYNWHIESEYSFLWPSEKTKLFNIIDNLIKFKKEKGIDIGNSVAQLQAFKTYFTDPNDFVKKHRQCRMGDGMLKVDPCGNVSLCAEKGSIGNVRAGRIEDIWFSKKAANVRESIRLCKINCPQLINCFFEE